MTDEWKPQGMFLDFLVLKFKSEGTDFTQALVGTGTKTYNPDDLIEEMRKGSRMGKVLYNTLAEKYKDEYGAYVCEGLRAARWPGKYS